MANPRDLAEQAFALLQNALRDSEARASDLDEQLKRKRAPKNRLEEQLDVLTHRLEKIEAERAQWEQQAGHLEEVAEAERTKVAQLKKKLEIAESGPEKLTKKEINFWRAKAESFDTETKEYRERLAALRRDLNEREALIEQLHAAPPAPAVDPSEAAEPANDELAALREQIEKRDQWLADLRTELNDARTQAAIPAEPPAELLAEIETLRRQMSSLELALAEAHNARAALQADLSRSQQDSAERDRVLRESTATGERTRALLAEREHRITEISAELEHLRADLRQREEQYREGSTQRDDQIAALARDLDDLKSRAAQEHHDAAAAQATVERLQSGMSLAEHRVATLGTEVGRLQNLLADREREHSAVAATSQSLQTLLGTRDSDLEQLNRDLEQRNGELDRFRQQLSERDHALNDHRQQLGERDRELNDSQQQLRDLGQRLAEREQKLTAVLGDVEHLKAASAASGRELSSLRDTLLASNRELEQLRQQKQHLETELGEARARLDAASTQDEELAALREEFSALQRERAAAQVQATALQNRQAAAEQQLAALADERDAAQERFQAVANDGDALREQLAALTNQHNAAQEQIAALLSQREAAQEQISGLEKELKEEREHAEDLGELANERREHMTKLQEQLEEAEERHEDAKYRLGKAMHFERLVKRRKGLVAKLLGALRAKMKANVALKAGLDGLRTYKAAAEMNQQKLLQRIEALKTDLREAEEASSRNTDDAVAKAATDNADSRTAELEARLNTQAEIIQSLEADLKTARLQHKAEKPDKGDDGRAQEIERLAKELETKNQVILRLEADIDEQQRKLAKLRGSEGETTRLKALTEKDRSEIDSLQREVVQLREALARHDAGGGQGDTAAQVRERDQTIARLMGTIREQETNLKKLTESSESWKRKYQFLASDEPDAYKNAAEK
jgi:chromosome segregation ATPase